MPLIDASYFTGYLDIPQTGQPSVAEQLNYFIAREEPLFLQAALGYEFYLDFMNALQQDPIPAPYLALRDGVDFTPDGLWPPFQWRNMWMSFSRDWFVPQKPVRMQHWVGFTGGASNFGNPNPLGPVLTLFVGQTTTVTINGVPTPIVGPTPGGNSYTNALLDGLSYWIEKRGYGPYGPTDVTITPDGQTFTLQNESDVFQYGEVLFLNFTNPTGQPGIPSVSYPSPIAGHVYYKYFRDQAANLSAFGVVSTDGENSTRSNGMLKMSDAFNRASYDILKLWQYIDWQSRANPTMYPNYDRLKIDYEYFKPINHFGI